MGVKKFRNIVSSERNIKANFKKEKIARCKKSFSRFIPKQDEFWGFSKVSIDV
jgi:Ca2+-binding EF-hand superfamily protein